MRVLELFSGTGSIGHVFRRRGHEVASLDLDPRCGADITCDVLEWDYEAHAPPGHYDVIWASPPCTMYSRARTTGGPRNLDLADSIVARTQQILEYFRPRAYIVENPASGLMASRPVTQRLNEAGSTVISYCSYGRLFQKSTRLWHNLPSEAWSPRPPCDRRCPAMTEDGRRRRQSAQRGPALLGQLQGRRRGDRLSLSELHAIPEALGEELAAACERLTLPGAPASE
jgi:hypothetical protein